MNPVGAPGEMGCCLVTQAQYEGLEQLWVGGKGAGKWRVDPQPQGQEDKLCGPGADPPRD